MSICSSLTPNEVVLRARNSRRHVYKDMDPIVQELILQRFQQGQVEWWSNSPAGWVHCGANPADWPEEAYRSIIHGKF
jgi:hypothetical protein